MSRTPGASDRGDAAAVTALFRQYLQERIDAAGEGLNFAEGDGDVTPYELAPVQPVDPRPAWADALTAARWLGVPALAGAKAPAEWPTLVANQDPALALAFCVGNFPQLVRNLHPLLHNGELTVLRQRPPRALASQELLDWAAQQREPERQVAAVGVLRLAGNLDEAAALLRRVTAPADWRPLLDNEAAALAWHAGDADEAAGRWQRLPDSVPVLFNRGMAALFLGHAAAAREPLTRAAADLPETSAWHHLGQLYLALAAVRG